MTSIKVLVSVLSVVALSTVACTRHHDNPAVSKANQNKLTKTFSAIDGTYNVNDLTLANKIEGISLESVAAPARGIIKGQILVQGQDAPVYYYSEALESDTLKTGLVVDIAAELPADNDLGGPLTGSFKCLNAACSEAAVYFRLYQGAGFIFKNDGTGFKLTNSVGSTVSLETALARRAQTVTVSK